MCCEAIMACLLSNVTHPVATAFARIDSLGLELWRIMMHPAHGGGVGNRQIALGHHLHQVRESWKHPRTVHPNSGTQPSHRLQPVRALEDRVADELHQPTIGR